MPRKKKRRINTQGGRLKKMEVPFTQVANSVLNDPKLSLRAKGLFAYIYSKPHGWEFSTWRMSKESLEGRDAIRTALQELIRAGFLIRKKLATGRVQFNLIFENVKPVEEEAVEIVDY